MSGQASTLLLLMTAALLAPVQAAGEDCAVALRDYEQKNKLSSQAPVLTRRNGAGLSDKLAESGGIVRPPDSGAGVVIAPPATGDEMATTPAPPEPGTGAAPQAEAARRALAETQLQSARAAARRGDEISCQRHLQEAQRLMDEG